MNKKAYEIVYPDVYGRETTYPSEWSFRKEPFKSWIDAYRTAWHLLGGQCSWKIRRLS